MTTTSARAEQRWAGKTHLTFDCYGTLIDWESGILAAVVPWLSRERGNARPIDPVDILQRYVAHEASLESQAWRPYREVLRGIVESLAADWGFSAKASDLSILADSLGDWPPFADTIEGLRRLSNRFDLVLLSNIDDELLAQTRRRLGVRISEAVTAEQVRSYKPGLAHFREALTRLGVPSANILHVAQSLYHDHVPAKRLGWQTVWVRRPSRLDVTGLAPATAMAAEVQPDFTVESMIELADALLR